MNSKVDDLIAKARQTDSTKVIIDTIDDISKDNLQILLDTMVSRLPQGICVLTHVEEGDLAILVTVSNSLHGKIKAGDFIKELAELAGGKGGGRPDRARAGSKNPEKAPEVLKAAKTRIAELLS